MVHLKNSTKAEIQATGFENVSIARHFLKDILKAKAQKYIKRRINK